jgi:hypothetical protein
LRVAARLLWEVEMRARILVAGAALAIAACGRGGPAGDNAVMVDDNLAAQNISANDTTAIDAVTGDAANMAADVNFTVGESDNLAAGNAGNSTTNEAD